MLRIEPHGKVVRYLSTRRDDYTERFLHVYDVHDTLEGQFVEIEPVAHVVVGRHCLGIVVNHYRAVALSSYGIKCLHSTPVELYAGAYAVCA